MNTKTWYKQADICRQANSNETVGKTDVLYCRKFDGECGVILCINGHKMLANNRK